MYFSNADRILYLGRKRKKCGFLSVHLRWFYCDDPVLSILFLFFSQKMEASTCFSHCALLCQKTSCCGTAFMNYNQANFIRIVRDLGKFLVRCLVESYHSSPVSDNHLSGDSLITSAEARM